MKLLYTNSSEPDGIQPIAASSIGGFVSSSPVPNSVLNELFGEVSLNRDYNTKYRLIAIKNTFNHAIDNLQLKFFLNEDIISKIQVALVEPSIDDCGNPVFERLINQYSKPMTGEFNEVEDGLLILGDSIESGAVLGLWISRQLDKELSKPKTCEELSDDFEQQVELETEDSIQIDISWTDPESISQSQSLSQSDSQSLSAS